MKKKNSELLTFDDLGVRDRRLATILAMTLVMKDRFLSSFSPFCTDRILAVGESMISNSKVRHYSLYITKLDDGDSDLGQTYEINSRDADYRNTELLVNIAIRNSFLSEIYLKQLEKQFPEAVIHNLIVALLPELIDYKLENEKSFKNPSKILLSIPESQQWKFIVNINSL